LTFSLTPQVFKLPGTFVLTDPLAPIVVPIELARAAHVKNLAVITIRSSGDDRADHSDRRTRSQGRRNRLRGCAGASRFS